MTKKRVHLRPLKVKDAYVSYKWRNDPEIWKCAKNKPDRYITIKMEKDWIKKVLADDRSVRRAICIAKNNTYIGNVYLTGINKRLESAETHIFIGDKKYWGKGFGAQVVKEIIKYAFEVLKLKKIDAEVNPKNVSIIKINKKCGFAYVDKPQERAKMVHMVLVNSR